MNKIEKVYYPRTSDFNLFGDLQPSSLLDLCQDMAGRHSEILGCGLNAMKERKLMWAIVRQKFNIVGKAELRGAVKVETWPLKRSRISFRREYRLSDENSNIIAVGAADWVLLDAEKRSIVSVENVYHLDGEFLAERALEEKLSRVSDFEPESEPYRIIPGFSDLDFNGHVNNSRYANYIMNASPLAEGEHIASLQMDYHREILCGAVVDILTKRTENELLAKGVNEAGELMFVCKMEITKD